MFIFGCLINCTKGHMVYVSNDHSGEILPGLYGACGRQRLCKMRRGVSSGVLRNIGTNRRFSFPAHYCRRLLYVCFSVLYRKAVQLDIPVARVAFYIDIFCICMEAQKARTVDIRQIDERIAFTGNHIIRKERE